MAAQNLHSLNLDVSPLKELDTFALLACQRYNHGNATDWFGSFRGGLHGFYARVYGVRTHDELLHTWLPRLRLPVDTEYHVTSLLFNMDSAIECFTFMLNALGNAVSPTAFRDVTAAKDLRNVAPKDIVENLVKGYASVFPHLQAHWEASRDLIVSIMENHDVSKHRQSIYSGGMLRQDPPKGFYERLKMGEDSLQKTLLSPHEETLLRANPKAPLVGRKPTSSKDRVILESIVKRFCDFINQSCVLARDDAGNGIKLLCDHFQET